MSRALLELLLLGFRGRIVRRLRLLKQPKYLVGLFAGLAYFALVFGPRYLAGAGRGRTAPLPGAVSEVVVLGLAVALALAATAAWILTSSTPLVALSEAEAHLLLPAPLPRRQVLRYALLKHQPGLLTGALVVAALRGAASSPGRLLVAAATMWGFLTLTDLHVKAVSFWKARTRELPPAAAWLRRGLALGIGLAFWGAVALAATRIEPPDISVQGAGGRDFDPAAAAGAWAEAARASALDEVLAPFLWVARALGAGGSAPAWGPVALAALALAHLAWVERAGVRFEEAALARARRRLDARTRRPRFARAGAAGRRREPFRLAAGGRPEAAILWKNLLLRGRRPVARTAAFILVGLGIVTAGLTALGAPPVPIAIAMSSGLALFGVVPLIAGLMLRHDLRVDLLHLETLRPWPLPGWRLVAAEVAAPAATALVLQVLGAGLVAASMVAVELAGGAARIPLPDRFLGGTPPLAMLAALLAGGLLAAWPVAVISILLQNLLALLLPAWVPLGLERGRGTAAFGQRLLLGIAHLAGLALGVLPAALLAGGGAVLLLALGLEPSVWWLPPLGLLAGVGLLAEAALLLRLAGAAWDRLDPSQELLAPRE